MNKLLLFLKEYKTRLDKIQKKSKNILSNREQIHFIERLSFLLGSGMPIIKSINLIKNQTKDERCRAVYHKITEDLSEGLNLSQSLRDLFDNFSLSVILIGEQSGFLSSNLLYLTRQLKKRREMVKNLKQAIIYPFFIALATIGITIFLILYIFPKILPVVKSLNVPLPFTTKTVIYLSSFISNWGIIVLIVFSILTVIFLHLLKRNNRLRYFINVFSLKVPIFGSIYKDFLLANFCHNLKLLLKSGLSIDIALKTVEFATNNLLLRFHIKEMYNFVSAGKTLSIYLSFHPTFFPDTLTELLSVAEETGNVSVVLANLADFHENQFVEKIKNLSQTIEPILLILAGIIVGFVAVSIVSPIYKVTNSLKIR